MKWLSIRASILRLAERAIHLIASVWVLAVPLAVAIPAAIAAIFTSISVALVAALLASLIVIIVLLELQRRTQRALRMVYEHRDLILLDYQAFGAMLPELIRTSSPRTVTHSLPISTSSDRVTEPASSPTPREVMTPPEPVAPPSSWLPDPTDLRTFAFSYGDFEKCAEQALAVTEHRFADEPAVYFDHILLACQPLGHPMSSLPKVDFLVVSSSAMKRTRVSFLGSLAHPKILTAPMPRSLFDWLRSHEIADPWHRDQSWTELVHLSWPRMETTRGPYQGAVILEACSRHLTGADCLWRIGFVPVQLDQSTKVWTLRKGELQAIHRD